MSFDKDGKPGADGSAAGWDAGGEHLTVPDDISELDADVRAYHRELRASRRRKVVRRLFLGSRFGITLPVLLAAFFLAALYSIVMLVVASPRPAAPHSGALASPKVAPGRPGGLLPKLRIEDARGNYMSLRALRPAVLLLSPARCDCAAPIQSAATAAEHGRISLTIIGSTPPVRPAGVSDSLARLRTEPTGQLLRAYQVHNTPVTLLVQADGVVSKVLRDLPSAKALDADVRALTATGTSH